MKWIKLVFLAEGCYCNIYVLSRSRCTIKITQCVCVCVYKHVRLFLHSVHYVLLCWAVGLPRGMNPLKLCLSATTGRGTYCLFFHCDLYGATASWPISHCCRQACKGGTASSVSPGLIVWSHIIYTNKTCKRCKQQAGLEWKSNDQTCLLLFSPIQLHFIVIKH